MKSHRRVIDTNRLIAAWHGKGPCKKKVVSEGTAVEVAQTWLKLNRFDGIVTPVRLEFLCGVRDAEELRLAQLFLDQFPLFDEGRVLPADWSAAERFAKRVGRYVNEQGHAAARQAIDCLVLAVCERLNLEVSSDDRRVKQH